MNTSIVNPWFVLSVALFIGCFWGFEYRMDTSLEAKQVVGYALWTIFGIVVISILFAAC
jgi:multidrug transporter EmrE-like cation transporter